MAFAQLGTTPLFKDVSSMKALEQGTKKLKEQAEATTKDALKNKKVQAAISSNKALEKIKGKTPKIKLPISKITKPTVNDTPIQDTRKIAQKVEKEAIASARATATKTLKEMLQKKQITKAQFDAAMKNIERQ